MTHDVHPVLGALLERAEPALRATETPGLTVAYRDRDGEIHAAALGVRRADTGEALTPDCLCSIASISKPVTATAIMRLAAQGRIALDDPLVGQLPAWHPENELAEVTPRHLLSHTSGFAGDFVPQLPENEDLLHRFTERVAQLQPIHRPGALYSYSNGAFNILGALIEHVTGERFDRAIRRLVLDPAGASEAAGYDFANAMTYPLIQGHVFGDDDTPEIARPWGTDRLSWPCGGLVTSMSDLLRFAALHLPGSSEGVLEDAIVGAMRTPVVQAAADEHMALGWFTDTGEDPGLVFHGGDGGGQGSELWLIPGTGEAFAWSANVLPESQPVAAELIAFVREHAGRPAPAHTPEPWDPERLQEVLGAWTAPGTGDTMTIEQTEADGIVGHWRSGEESAVGANIYEIPPIPLHTTADGLLVPSDPVWQQAFSEPVRTADGELLLRVAQRLFVRVGDRVAA